MDAPTQATACHPPPFSALQLWCHHIVVGPHFSYWETAVKYGDIGITADGCRSDPPSHRIRVASESRINGSKGTGATAKRLVLERGPQVYRHFTTLRGFHHTLPRAHVGGAGASPFCILHRYGLRYSPHWWIKAPTNVAVIGGFTFEGGCA